MKRILSLLLLAVPFMLTAQNEFQSFETVRTPSEVKNLRIPASKKAVEAFVKKIDRYSSLQSLSIDLPQPGADEADLLMLGKVLGKKSKPENLSITVSSFDEVPETFSKIGSLKNLDVHIVAAEDLYLRSKTVPASASVRSIRNYDLICTDGRMVHVRCSGFGNVMTAEDELRLRTVFSASAVTSNTEQLAENEIKPFTGKTYAIVQPPIANIEKPKNEYVMNPSGPATLLYGSGTVLNIPANAFVDEQGKPVTENVNVYYREFRDQFDILMSGIPMTYEENGVQGNFETAGMFEITATTASGKEVFLGPGKEIGVELATTDTSSGFDFFELKDNTAQAAGGWQKLGAAPKADTLNTSKMQFSDAAMAYRVRPRSSVLYPDTVSLQSRYESDAYFYTDKFRPGIDTTKYKFRVTRRKNYHLKTYSTRSLVYLKKTWGKDKSKTYFKICYNRRKHPELIPLDGKVFEMNGKMASSDFREKYGKNRRFNDLRLTGEGSAVNVELKGWTNRNSIDATLVSLNNDTKMYEEMQAKKAANSMMAYNKSLSLRKRQFNRKIARQLFQFTNYRMLMHNDSLKEWKKVRKLMTEQEKGMSFTEWAQYAQAEKTKAILKNPELDLNTKMYRGLAISGLGIFNCDRLIRDQSTRTVKLELYDESGKKIKAVNTTVVDRSINGVFSFGGGSTAAIRITRGAVLSFFAILGATQIGLLTPEEFNKQVGNDDSKKAKVNLKIIDTKNLTFEEVRRMLGM